MSNTLIEKKIELERRHAALVEARRAEIDKKVEEYRRTLEMTTPSDEIDKVSAVIAALDEVIQYDSLHAQTTVAQTTVREDRSNGRQGMANVVVPR